MHGRQNIVIFISLHIISLSYPIPLFCKFVPKCHFPLTCSVPTAHQILIPPVKIYI